MITHSSFIFPFASSHFTLHFYSSFFFFYIKVQYFPIGNSCVRCTIEKLIIPCCKQSHARWRCWWWVMIMAKIHSLFSWEFRLSLSPSVILYSVEDNLRAHSKPNIILIIRFAMIHVQSPVSLLWFFFHSFELMNFFSEIFPLSLLQLFAVIANDAYYVMRAIHDAQFDSLKTYFLCGREWRVDFYCTRKREAKEKEKER